MILETTKKIIILVKLYLHTHTHTNIEQKHANMYDMLIVCHSSHIRCYFIIVVSSFIPHSSHLLKFHIYVNIYRYTHLMMTIHIYSTHMCLLTVYMFVKYVNSISSSFKLMRWCISHSQENILMRYFLSWNEMEWWQVQFFSLFMYMCVWCLLSQYKTLFIYFR